MLVADVILHRKLSKSGWLPSVIAMKVVIAVRVQACCPELAQFMICPLLNTMCYDQMAHMCPLRRITPRSLGRQHSRRPTQSANSLYTQHQMLLSRARHQARQQARHRPQCQAEPQVWSWQHQLCTDKKVPEHPLSHAQDLRRCIMGSGTCPMSCLPRPLAGGRGVIGGWCSVMRTRSML